MPAEGSAPRADSKGEGCGLVLFGVGGEWLSRGCVELAADLTRREVDFGGGSVGVRGRWCGRSRWRLDWRWDIEFGVALPELEAVLGRKRDIPSAGMDCSLKRVDPRPGEPTLTGGVILADMFELLGIGA